MPHRDRIATTGRLLVVFRDGYVDEGVAHMRDAAGLESVDAGARTYRRLGAAVVNADPNQAARLTQSSHDSLLVVRPERILSLPSFGPSKDEDRGLEAVPAPRFDESERTWALQAMNVAGTKATGKGIKVAVLDTGVARSHVDIAARIVDAAPFVKGQDTVEDGYGHGTFCAGVIAGAVAPEIGPRYGIAPDVDLFVGKVLDDEGKGPESDILAGMEWALSSGCRIISFSAGMEATAPPDAAYAEFGERARAQNCLLVAAAGNESHRPGEIVPVCTPANVPPFLAVASVNDHFILANDCNGQKEDGTGVSAALVAPGVRIRSAWPHGTGYYTASGTSAAVPQVVGLAALLLEERPEMSVAGLVEALLTLTTMTNAMWKARDVGRGFPRLP